MFMARGRDDISCLCEADFVTLLRKTEVRTEQMPACRAIRHQLHNETVGVFLRRLLRLSSASHSAALPP